MLDAVSLDQLRTFIAAADQGSFSAAGRKLGRAQSVVSQTLANLEAQLEVQLFDRSGRRPVLTSEGQALMRQAREVVGAMDQFKTSARGLAGGREPELSIAVDVLFPIGALTDAVAGFSAAFPDTPLRIYVEVLGAVLQPVLDGRCSLCVMNSIPLAPGQLATEPMCDVPMVVVAAAGHPLAKVGGRIDRQTASEYVQLVLTDRSNLTQGREFGVFGEKTWRLADLGAKHEFLKAGLGWGGMPRHLVEADLDSGALGALDLEANDGAEMAVRMAAAWRIDAPPGLAGRWMIDRLRRGGAHQEPRA
jgi:DNA-binding transcriptional LysR family regulator